jgi:hypothetical protein
VDLNGGLAGVSIAPVLKEAAEVSSDVNKYGMGSTHSLLLREYERAFSCET